MYSMSVRGNADCNYGQVSSMLNQLHSRPIWTSFIVLK